MFVENVPLDTLMTMRLLCKDWRRVADKFIDGMIESGGMIAHGGNDISYTEADAQRERRSLVTQVVFLLNVTKVGISACRFAVNLVVAEIPEGLVPSHIDVAQHNYGGEEWVNHTPKVIAYLRSQQS
ncbi:hypothetical protein TrVE_jg3911 [Triparma verrucosa]|uniref:Uncharacterized protein n=1 Tax=Triparma verrucosa TaxID=1606542 RepID=A0A9W7C4X4_9STRA|nr:hypothetical protein TrVE_jg3911 [Triparma verrucosa]